MTTHPESAIPVSPPIYRRERRWVPVIAVIAVIALVDGGARIVGAASAQPAGPARDVGGAVRIQPLAGWGATEQQGGTTSELVLSRGGVTLDVIAIVGSNGTADEVAGRYVQEILRPRFDELTIGQPDASTLASGLPVIRFGYVGVASGVPTEGVVTAAVAQATAAVFDAFAPKGDLAWAAPDLETMIRGAEVG
jgi:hypothetical protein